MALVLDAGGLIAIDRSNRRVGALLRVAQEAAVPVVTSSAAVAQVWRHGSRQANLARTLTGLAIAILDLPAARPVGELLNRAGTADVVDAHVALLVRDADTVLTSDRLDIHRLLEVRRVRATVEIV